LYVSLEPQIGRDIIVPKRVEESYLGKTFNELVDYMRKEESDELNPEAYDPDQRYAISKVNEWFLKYESGTTSIGIDLRAKTDDDSRIGVRLEDKVADYADRIILDKEINVDGEDVSYKEIVLSISPTFAGGR
jgi:hypothetical protein